MFINFKNSPFLLITFFNFLIFNSSFSHDYYFGKLTIDHPYIIETLPNAKVAAGYLTITNRGKKSEFLVQAKTSFSSYTEFHKMIMEDNVMKMTKLDKALEILPGKTLKLKPKGLHIMFVGLNKKLKKDNKEKVLLVFQHTGKIIVDFNIESMDQNKSHH